MSTAMNARVDRRPPAFPLLRCAVASLILWNTLGARATAAEPEANPADPAASIRLPALQVSENRRCLVTEQGEPFFWTGDTAWELFHRLDREEADRYLSDRARRGFNVIQAVALAELDGLTEPNRFGFLPLVDKDPARPDVQEGANNDYWDFVDEVLGIAARKGLYVGFLPTWGSHVTSAPFDGQVNGVFTVANAESYGRFLGERYGSLTHLIWILGGDKMPSTPEALAIWRALARGIALGVSGQEDYSRVLMTYHVAGPGHASEYVHDEPWLDFTSTQSSHGDMVESWRFIERHWNRAPIKPVIDLESSYPGLLIPAAWLPENLRASHPSTQPANDHHARRAAYWAVFAGAFGHTYGHNSIWQMHGPGRKGVLEPTRTWSDALRAPSADQMGHLRRLMESRPLMDRLPDQALVHQEPGQGRHHIRASRGRDHAMVYLPTGREVVIKMGIIPGEMVRAWWFNPRDGRASLIGTFPNNGFQKFAGAGEPAVGNDWVLVLEDAAHDYPPPGQVRQ
jgi:hypothetical protein